MSNKALVGYIILILLILFGFAGLTTRVIEKEEQAQKEEFLECVEKMHYCQHSSIMGDYLLTNCSEKLNLDLMLWCYEKFVE